VLEWDFHQMHWQQLAAVSSWPSLFNGWVPTQSRKKEAGDVTWRLTRSFMYSTSNQEQSP
jgi:hypothetical protein